MMDILGLLENHRLEIQAELDHRKPKAERNRLGQFATPPQLATFILEQAKRLMPANQAVRFLDPAFGTGAFYSALLGTFPENRIEAALGYEIDPLYGEAAKLLWRGHALKLVVGDFTMAQQPENEANRYNLIICNPPYVRHHHLKAEQKKRLQAHALRYANANLSSLSGLYAYFLCIAHAWLQEGGLAGWLIPSEFMNVNYGRVVRQYLTSEVSLLDIHRFDPEAVQFDDALVSSTVVWIRKRKPQPHETARFSLGGSLGQPRQYQDIPIADLRHEPKWTRFPKQATAIADNPSAVRFDELFDIKRGVATGANQFFILNSEQIKQHDLPVEFFVPILPSPRYLETDEIFADTDGIPLLKARAFLLNCDLPEDQVMREFPSLWRYLQKGKGEGIHQRYLCTHRTVWYAQDKREPAPFLCTYMGRQSNGQSDNPFRFILNHSQAVAPNVYLNIYPKPALANLLVQKPELKQTIWNSLRKIPAERLLGEGRVYGGGLYKIEPKELSNLRIDGLFDAEILPPVQQRLF
jgi:hypothetical protein